MFFCNTSTLALSDTTFFKCNIMELLVVQWNLFSGINVATQKLFGKAYLRMHCVCKLGLLVETLYVFVPAGVLRRDF